MFKVKNSITTLKRHLQASLNVFFNKKKFDDDKIIYLNDRFFVSNRKFFNFTCNFFLIPGF